jgi:hypothetical protein
MHKKQPRKTNNLAEKPSYSIMKGWDGVEGRSLEEIAKEVDEGVGMRY